MQVITDYRYTLDPRSKKHICPNCGKKRFSLYIDTHTNQYLSEIVGRCDREESCAYHYKPADYFKSNPNARDRYTPPIKIVKPYRPMSLMPESIVQKYLGNYENNTLYRWLITLPCWSNEIAKNALMKYKVGTAMNGYLKHSPIFWQIDTYNRVRSGKIIKYKLDGHRDKNVNSNWVHSLLKKANTLKEYNLSQCLFGLHLINDSDKPIAIVESEKTAIIASEYFPNYTWLACGGVQEIKYQKLRPIKHWPITLFPDLSKPNATTIAIDVWRTFANVANIEGYNIKVSDILEQISTDQQQYDQCDIADILVTRDLSKYNACLVTTRTHKGGAVTVDEYGNYFRGDKGYPDDWDFHLPDYTPLTDQQKANAIPITTK